MATGLIPVIAHSYAFILDWIIEFIGKIFKLNQQEWFKIVKWIFYYIIKIGIVYYFVYALSAFIFFPLSYQLHGDGCRAIEISNKAGYAIAVTFIIIYAIFNIPDELLVLGRKLGEVTIYTDIIFSPFLGILKEFADIGKFGPLYAIPFLGTPMLEAYHIAVGVISTLTYTGVEELSMFNCDHPKIREELTGIVENWYKPEFAVLKEFILNYGIGKKITRQDKNGKMVTEYKSTLMEVLAIGLSPKLQKHYKCLVDNMAFWEKIYKKDAQEYYAGSLATKGFCFGLKVIQGFANLFDSLGGPERVANMIKTGNIAGIGGFIAFIVCMILVFIGVW